MTVADLISPEARLEMQKQMTEILRKEFEPVIKKAMDDSFMDAIDVVIHVLNGIDQETIDIQVLKDIIGALKTRP